MLCSIVQETRLVSEREAAVHDIEGTALSCLVGRDVSSLEDASLGAAHERRAASMRGIVHERTAPDVQLTAGLTYGTALRGNGLQSRRQIEPSARHVRDVAQWPPVAKGTLRQAR